jgi:hypothetical protein
MKVNKKLTGKPAPWAIGRSVLSDKHWGLI